jgi:hypothetical protein
VVLFRGLTALAQVANTASAPAAQIAQTPITVLEDTLLRVRTMEPINSKRANHGTPVLFTLSEDVMVHDALAIPRGATVHGKVIERKQAGRLTGSPELTLQLISLDLGGRSYPLDSYQFKVKGLSKTQPTEAKALRGAEVGAVVGSVVSGVSTKGGIRTPSDGSGRAASMTAGAVIGAGVGTLVSASTPGPGIWIPSESQVDFYLAVPVTVTPVSAKEAARLAQGFHAGGPTLYVRETP